MRSLLLILPLLFACEAKPEPAERPSEMRAPVPPPCTPGDSLSERPCRVDD